MGLYWNHPLGWQVMEIDYFKGWWWVRVYRQPTVNDPDGGILTIERHFWVKSPSASWKTWRVWEELNGGPEFYPVPDQFKETANAYYEMVNSGAL